MKYWIVCCAIVKEKMSLGPTTISFGVNPLKRPPNPSFFNNLVRIETPDSGESKGLFCIRVWNHNSYRVKINVLKFIWGKNCYCDLTLITSNGWAMLMEATAPAEDARAFCAHVACWPSPPTPMNVFAAELPPNRAKEPGAFYAEQRNKFKNKSYH